MVFCASGPCGATPSHHVSGDYTGDFSGDNAGEFPHDSPHDFIGGQLGLTGGLTTPPRTLARSRIAFRTSAGSTRQLSTVVFAQPPKHWSENRTNWPVTPNASKGIWSACFRQVPGATIWGAQGGARFRLHLRPRWDHGKTTFARPIHHEYTVFHAMWVGQKPVSDCSENTPTQPGQSG